MKHTPLPRRPKIETVNRRQLLLRTVDVEQLVPEDDPIRAIWELTERLNLEQFYKTIISEEGQAGREAIDPRVLISLWVYAYSRGISSAREISREMEYHPGFQWLSGMRPINYHTLSDFRIRHAAALDDLFTQLLGVLSSEGLLTLERVMQDGTKVKANAGSDSFRREERLREHLRLAGEQVEAMKEQGEDITSRLKASRERAALEKAERLQRAVEELEKVRQQPCAKTKPEEARVSWSDPESRIMKHGGGGGYSPSYNIQLTTDAAAGAIVDATASQSPVDAKELPAAMQRVTDRLGQKPLQAVADAEFTTNATVMALDRMKVDFIGSLRPPKTGMIGSLARRGIDPAFGPEAFQYKEKIDVFICPNQKILRRERSHVAHWHQETYYRARSTDCAVCPFRQKCCPKHWSKGRAVMRSRLEPVIAAFRQRMKTDAAKEIYRQRGGIAEFTNAWLKDKLGLRQFRLRGLLKVGLETLWASLTCNIQLWIRRIWRPLQAAIP